MNAVSNASTPFIATSNPCVRTLESSLAIVVPVARNSRGACKVRRNTTPLSVDSDEGISGAPVTEGNKSYSMGEGWRWWVTNGFIEVDGVGVSGAPVTEGNKSYSMGEGWRWWVNNGFIDRVDGVGVIGAPVAEGNKSYSMGEG